ncbi:Hypothetical protein D9617_1g079810 [Elsinoe fawcettii]|nr:Hypothetical protein D9617_1g079810 [Elsinoe fawcettii]
MSHTRKKQFNPASQPSITSFFASSGSGNPTPSSAPDTPTRSGLSPLPTQIQSSLLNVGMRVRKSVPEGYKTHKTLPSSFPYATAQTEVRAIASSQRAAQCAQNPRRTGQAGNITNGGVEAVPSSAPPALLRSVSDRSRELQPFCGLHSVGGMDGQDQEMVVPGLSWSQSTSGSHDGGNERKREREYEEEVEAELDEFFDEVDVQPVGRKIAPLRRGGGAGGRAAGAGGVVRVLDDFDDADVAFLEPMDVDA